MKLAKKVKIEIELGNDAMQTFNDLSLVLKELSERFNQDFAQTQSGHRIPVYDLNGNSVGMLTTK